MQKEEVMTLKHKVEQLNAAIKDELRGLGLIVVEGPDHAAVSYPSLVSPGEVNSQERCTIAFAVAERP